MKESTLEGKKKTQNGVKRVVFSGIAILLEVLFIIALFTRLNEYAVGIDLVTRILAVILVLKIYGTNQTATIKTPWIILILVFPIMGVTLFFLVGLDGGTRKMKARYDEIDKKLLPMLPQNDEKLNELQKKIPKAGNIAYYIQKNAK